MDFSSLLHSIPKRPIHNSALLNEGELHSDRVQRSLINYPPSPFETRKSPLGSICSCLHCVNTPPSPSPAREELSKHRSTDGKHSGTISHQYKLMIPGRKCFKFKLKFLRKFQLCFIGFST